MSTGEEGVGVGTGGRDAQLREWAAAVVAEHAAQVAADPWRQSFHIQPQVGALIDPVGLAQLGGVFHFCHLLQPDPQMRRNIYWVHLSSTDLVNWSDPVISLAPSSYYDSHGCYSGSAITHSGQVHFLYTGNVRTDDGGRIPYQCLATLAPDGTAIKHDANPLFGPIPGYTPHLRDPQVLVDGDRFLMVLGAQSDDLHGSLLLLRSQDLIAWEFLGRIAGGPAESFGYMWECPGLVRLVDQDPAGAELDPEPSEVLIFSPQFDHGPQAGAGRFEDVSDYTVGKLNLEPPHFEHGEMRRIDMGADFYAPRTFVDESGRTIMLAWMGMPVHDGQPTIDVQHPTVARGWVHCLTVPRSLELVGGRLVQWPVVELDRLHGARVEHRDVRVGSGQRVTLEGVAGRALDLQLWGAAEPGACLVLRLREGAGQATLLTVDPNAGQVTLDRSDSGPGLGGVYSGALDPAAEFALRVLVDHSSVEVFVAGGRLAMSARIYPEVDSTGISFAATGGAITLSEVTCFQMARG